MSERLYTATEAARAINPHLGGATFRRYADRLGVPYHKIGRERYYTPEAIEAVKRGTMKWPEGEKGPACVGDAGRGLSGGRTLDQHASVAQALRIAQKLRRSSPNGSPASESARKGSVVPLTISSPTA